MFGYGYGYDKNVYIYMINLEHFLRDLDMSKFQT